MLCRTAVRQAIRLARAMSATPSGLMDPLYVNKDTKVICQGMTGSQVRSLLQLLRGGVFLSCLTGCSHALA